MIETFRPKIQWDREVFDRRMKLNQDIPANEPIRKVLPDIFLDIRRNVRISARYICHDGSGRTGIDDVDCCEHQIICLIYLMDSTLAPADRYLEQERFLEAYLYHEVADAVLFDASVQLSAYLQKTEEKKGRHLTRGYFPGDGDLPICLQDRLLEIFVDEAMMGHKGVTEQIGYRDLARSLLGVTTNEDHMLVPEKAMLYAIGSDRCNPENGQVHDCQNCSRTDCTYYID